MDGLGVAEQAATTRPINAQSAGMAHAMASICNAGRMCFGGLSGHDGFVHTFYRLNQTKYVIRTKMPSSIANCGLGLDEVEVSRDGRMGVVLG